MIEFGWFRSHSGIQLPWKINADTLSDTDIDGIARIIRRRFAFSNVIGVPRGGLRLAEALKPHVKPGWPELIVDDVLTTGESMEAYHLAAPTAIGVVIFARSPVPDWVWSIFQVCEWTQIEARAGR
jgi:hypoxanthine phosphoribosyltransferase